MSRLPSAGHAQPPSRHPPVPPRLSHYHIAQLALIPLFFRSIDREVKAAMGQVRDKEERASDLEAVIAQTVQQAQMDNVELPRRAGGETETEKARERTGTWMVHVTSPYAECSALFAVHASTHSANRLPLCPLIARYLRNSRLMLGAFNIATSLGFAGRGGRGRRCRRGPLGVRWR